MTPRVEYSKLQGVVRNPPGGPQPVREQLTRLYRLLLKDKQRTDEGEEVVFGEEAKKQYGELREAIEELTGFEQVWGNRKASGNNQQQPGPKENTGGADSEVQKRSKQKTGIKPQGHSLLKLIRSSYWGPLSWSSNLPDRGNPSQYKDNRRSRRRNHAGAIDRFSNHTNLEGC